MMVDSVSISITSAIVYGVSGGLFFLLIFLLILIGLCNCNCDNYRCCRKKKRKNGSRVGNSDSGLPTSAAKTGPQTGGGRMVAGAGNHKKAPDPGLSSVTSKQSLSDLRQQ